MTVGVVDYGTGNLRSVQKAFEYLGAECRILGPAEDYAAVERLVLPGVGSFGHAMLSIEASRLYRPLMDWIGSGRPLLGICLGLQLLFESSEESMGVRGLSVFKGTCRRFREKKVPQIGWNNVRARRENRLLQGMAGGEFFYFNHSYFVVPEEEEVVLAETDYGVIYTSIAGKDNISGVQFHPEKSGRAGLETLENWMRSW
ncbi:MAG: imidazole glycerol phosphate synthase, glutamine amidotransferase subunit [candidate division Zixibacteria bacterium RBG_16_53_22]|nr:MAG: imidazole glycerol phosphate synthase, glutamine amidotransferase subunit [candidate division Zixibacteria bacterium RBG_16_53_22]